MARIPTIRGGRTLKRGVSQATRSSESKVDKRFLGTPMDWVRKGVRVGVKSSNVRAIAYDMENKLLWVEFGVGGRPITHYKYLDVHFNTARAMFNAPSCGKFVNRILKKGNYVYDGPVQGPMPHYVA